MNFDHSLGAIERTTHYHQNPWCPSSLKASAELLKSKDMEKYLHVYEGYYYQSSERSIFGKLIKKRMFEVDGSFRGCFIGVDWGFSNDPTCVVEAWIKERDLYIRRSASKVNLKLTDTPSWLLKHVPLIATYTSRADSARPETIDICRNKINLMKPAKKQSGSVESGINYIQSFDNIFIHPDCQQDTAIELASYSWKLDKYEEITRIPEDKNNHYADALRYALEPELKQKTTFAVA
jgi:phage terminase large subunit